MVELTKEEANELLNYITQLVIGTDPECPTEVINKLSEQAED